MKITVTSWDSVAWNLEVIKDQQIYADWSVAEKLWDLETKSAKTVKLNYININNILLCFIKRHNFYLFSLRLRHARLVTPIFCNIERHKAIEIIYENKLNHNITHLFLNIIDIQINTFDEILIRKQLLKTLKVGLCPTKINIQSHIKIN